MHLIVTASSTSIPITYNTLIAHLVTGGTLMSISVVCPQCASRLNAPDIAAGKKVKCPKCQSLVNVPTTTSGPSAGYVVVESPAAAPPVPPSGGPSRRLLSEVTEEDDDGVPVRGKHGSQSDSDSNVMLIRNIIGGIVLVILLGVAGYIYYTKFFANKNDEDQASAPSSNNIATPPPGGFVPLEKAQDMGKGPPLMPLIPGGPVAGGVGPKPGGGAPIPGTGGGSPRPKGVSSPTITTSAGLTVTFPGPPRKSENLSQLWLRKHNLSGDVYLWIEGRNACTLVSAQSPQEIAEDQLRKVCESIIQEVANLDSGYKLMERNTVTHNNRVFDRFLCRSSDEEKSIETWMLISGQNIFIASVEITKSEASPAVQQFLNNIR